MVEVAHEDSVVSQRGGGVEQRDEFVQLLGLVVIVQVGGDNRRTDYERKKCLHIWSHNTF